MKRWLSALALATAITLGAGALHGCAVLKKSVGYPDVSVQDVSLGGLNLSGLKFTFDIEIKNNYNADLPLVGFDYALSSEGNLLLNGDTPVSSLIPAKTARVVPLTLTVPYGAVMDLKDRVRPGASVPYRADLGIKVDAPVVGVVTLPLGHDGVFSIPSFP